ncbi:MAG: 4Fe-4S dicluster domain-containing protein [Candidatus Nezhaarchaeota archaeon]|nr:4Fe-4S dicluster domain-containing protein [Candidatus Nezhaarchaeota archaeon]
MLLGLRRWLEVGKVFIIDVSKCNGCYDCQLACKDEHVDNDWSPYAKPQPDTGHFWLKIYEFERGTIPKVKVTYIPRICMHCDNPPCMAACPVGAIVKRTDGIVLIDPEKCNGCKKCISACPYEAIYFNDQLNIAQKCTGCAHLIDGRDPLINIPRCVDVCPFDAIKIGEEEELKDLIKKAETLNPEFEKKRPFAISKSENVYKPRVYYLNLPRPFIAGAVYDPDVDECIEGAKVIAEDEETKATYTTVTDEFGDFWLKDLEWNRSYTIRIEKEGYEAWVLSGIRTDKDVNLGDIALIRKTK